MKKRPPFLEINRADAKRIALVLFPQIRDEAKRELLLTQLADDKIYLRDHLRAHLSLILNDGVPISEAKKSSKVKITTGPIDNLADLIRKDKEAVKSHNFEISAINAIKAKVCPGESDFSVWLKGGQSKTILLDSHWKCYYRTKVGERDAVVVAGLHIDKNRRVKLSNYCVPLNRLEFPDYIGELCDNPGQDQVYIILKNATNVVSNSGVVHLCFAARKLVDKPEIMIGQYIRNDERTCIISSGMVVIVANSNLWQPAWFWIYPLNGLPSTDRHIGKLLMGFDIIPPQRTPTKLIETIKDLETHVKNLETRSRRTDRWPFDAFISCPIGKNKSDIDYQQLKHLLSTIERLIDENINLYKDKSERPYKFSNPIKRLDEDYRPKGTGTKPGYSHYKDVRTIDIYKTIERIYNSRLFILVSLNGIGSSSALMEAAWAIQFRIPSLFIVGNKDYLPLFLQRQGEPPKYVCEIGDSADIESILASKWDEITIALKIQEI